MISTGRRYLPAAAVFAALTAVLFTSVLGTTPTVITAVLVIVTAATVAWLAAHPLRISLSDDFPLLFVPVLVALGLGKPLLVLAGTFLGLTIAVVREPTKWGGAKAVEEATALTGGVLAATAMTLPLIPYRLGGLVVAALVYAAIRTPLVATRIARNERTGWSRAFVVVGSGYGTSLVTSVALALATVAVERLWLSHASPIALSALPLLAGGVVLHVFHPHSMSGREERRVLATTAVLADAMDVKDTLTGLHSQAVAQLSKRIARAVGVSERLAHDAFLTGLLHDIGKVVVPDSILQKPSQLQPAEWQVMRSHVIDSSDMVASIAGLARIAPCVRASHERFDGTGYPDGLRGREIPLAARIVAIADAYHALTNDRVYRPRRDPDAALRELERCAGTQFDPSLVRALRSIIDRTPAAHPDVGTGSAPTWFTLLRRPAFALLWGGELVSFLGDEVFFIAITLWVYTLTGSTGMLAAALGAGYAGQAVFSFLAGVVADRVDRRIIVAISDVARALVVAALPFVLPWSLPAAFVLLGLLNVGSAFFKAAVNALVPSIATREELETANALYQTTERIAEIVGGVLGATAVVVLGYSRVMFADAASFLVSASCVMLIPIAWGAGLLAPRRVSIGADLVAGVRYLLRTPFQRYFAFLILPGYITLAFDALRAPLVLRTAHLSAEAYGVINSTLGVARLVTAFVLAGLTKRWASPGLAIVAYLLTGVGIAIFTAFPWYLGLLAGAFLFATGNMLSLIVNSTLIMQRTPQAFLGRVLGNRQVLVQGTRVISVLALGRLADRTTPQAAAWVMVILSLAGVLAIWLTMSRSITPTTPLITPPERAGVPESEV